MDYSVEIYSLPKQHYTFQHFVTFVLTFLSVVSTTVVWKTLANVKPFLVREWTPYENSEGAKEIYPKSLWESEEHFDNEDAARQFLGDLDFMFLFCNGIALYLAGALGDRFGNFRKWFICFSMSTTAISAFCFGCLPDFEDFFCQGYLLIMIGLTGLFSAPTLPTSLGVMSKWFGRSRRGTIFGLWITSSSVGSILCNLMIFSVIDYGYSYGYVVSCLFLASCFFFVLCGLNPTPESIGLQPVIENDPLENVTMPTNPIDQSEDDMMRTLRALNTGTFSSSGSLISSGDSTVMLTADKRYVQGGSSGHPSVGGDLMTATQKLKMKAVAFRRAWAHPGVGVLAICTCCLRAVTYSVIFWLPTYLTDEFGISNSVAVRSAAFFDLGAIIGGILLGMLADWLKYESLLLSCGILLSTIFSGIFCYAAKHEYEVWVSLCAIGLFMGGSTNLISGPITARLANQMKQRRVEGAREAMSTLSGIIEGTASLGAAFAQIVIPKLVKKTEDDEGNSSASWNFVFYFLLAATALSWAVIIFPTIKDILEINRKIKQQKRVRLSVDPN